jgi:hypothetical protein
MNCDESIPPYGETPCRPIYVDPLIRYQLILKEFIPKFEAQYNDKITSVIFNEQEYREITFGHVFNTIYGKPIVLSKDVKRGHFAITLENNSINS